MSEASWAWKRHPPKLAVGEVHVWQAELVAGLDDPSVLDGHERHWVTRLRFRADRDQYVRSHVATRRILASYVGTDPAEVSFSRQCPRCGGEHGKPRMSDAPELDFSLSRCGNLVLLAVTSRRQVGVDLEIGARCHQVEEVVPVLCSPAELVELQAIADPQARRRALLALWTRKEAVVKAIGLGLFVDLRGVELRMTAPKRWLARVSGHEGLLHVEDLSPPSAGAGAVAWSGPAAAVRQWRGGPWS